MPKLPQHIEERFDKEFIYPFGDGSRDAVWSISMENKIKSFIATILNEEREGLVNEVENLKTKVIDENGCTGTTTSGWCCSKHKLACKTLDSVINLIKEDEVPTK